MGKNQPMRPEPWLKHMESYDSFQGGMNSVSDDTNVRDDEVRLLENREIGPRGSLRRRHGMVHHIRRPRWGDIKGKVWGEL